MAQHSFAKKAFGFPAQKFAHGSSFGLVGPALGLVGGGVGVVGGVVVMISITVFGQLLKAGMSGPDGKQFGSPFKSGPRQHPGSWFCTNCLVLYF